MGNPGMALGNPLLKAGSREAGGLVRQVVGIGGVEVGKTYSYTALELVCSGTACCMHIANIAYLLSCGDFISEVYYKTR